MLEAVKDAYKQELSDLCTTMEETKLKLSNYIKQVILQVTEWEINVDKDLLAANIFKFQVKFYHAYISSLLTEDNYNTTTTSYINARS